MAFLNLLKDWVFLIEPGRSFHNLGAATWKDRWLSVVSVLPLQGARSKLSLERKSYLLVSLTEVSSLFAYVRSSLNDAYHKHNFMHN